MTGKVGVTSADSSQAARQNLDQMSRSQLAVHGQMVRSFVVSRGFILAGELGISSHLEDGACHVDDLARSVEADADSLYRLLRMLAAHGVFTEVAERIFANTPVSSALRPGGVWRAFLEMPGVIGTGRSGLELAFGVDVWDYLDSRPEVSAIFSRAVAASHEGEADLVARTYDWSRAKTVLDVGGGLGELMVAILEGHCHLTGVLVERGAVVSEARATLAERGLADRCEVLEADILTSLPAVEADVAILSHIVHDWDDQAAADILRNAAAVIRPGGRLLILEAIIAPGDTPDSSKVHDMLMMVTTGGRERTQAEYRDLLARAGLRLTEVVYLPPTRWGTHLIEAVLD